MNKKNYSLFFAIACVSLFLFIFGETLLPQVVSSFNKFSSQFFYYLNPKENLAQDIVVVQIDDYSLSEVNKTWPFPRSFYAKALNILNEEGAKVVALDIVFQGKGPSEEDDLLLKQALENLKGKAILASYYNPDGVLESSELFGDYATVTFVEAIVGKDGLAKSLRALIQRESFFKFCWAIEAVAKYKGVVPHKQADTIVLGKQAIPFDSGGVFPINYLLKPKDFNVVPFYDLLQRDYPDNFFKGKIVLIGSTAEIVHDILLTPLERMPGVFIQANGIVGILEGKYLEVVHPAFTLAILFITLGLIALTVVSFSLLRSLVLCIGYLLGLFWLTIGLKFLGWDLSFGALALSVLSFFVLGNLYNYFRFIAVLARIKTSMTIDPFSKLFRLRYFYERLNLEAGSLPRKKLQIVIVSLEGFAEATKGGKFENLQKLWGGINSVLFGNGELWARCNQEVIIGAMNQNLNLNKLKKSLDVIFFEHELPIKVKLGVFKLKGSSNVRDIIPYVVSELAKYKEDLLLLDDSQLPNYKVQRSQGNDFITSLYADSEMKNQELLDAIERRTEEEAKRQKTYLQVITSLVTALESKDPYTEGHSEKVARYAILLADAAGVSAEEKAKIKTASLLHDLGKIGIPDNVLHKKGKLTPEEFAFIKEHEVLSAKILEPLEEFAEVIPYILHHHEDYDGCGYPHGLAGNFIPLGARIIAIADVFDALSTGRDYRDALSVEQTMQIIRDMKGKRLDPELVDIFLKIVEKEYLHR
ncbi:MAG: CHASE2 domain-containing protein [Candidatus Omnitrophica bacterium]|nr:CHASE2 domain-containing protein [Candidatus Omnitrophota bacterium]